MVQGGVDGVEMTHFLHPHDQEGGASGVVNCVSAVASTSTAFTQPGAPT